MQLDTLVCILRYSGLDIKFEASSVSRQEGNRIRSLKESAFTEKRRGPRIDP